MLTANTVLECSATALLEAGDQMLCNCTSGGWRTNVLQLPFWRVAIVKLIKLQHKMEAQNYDT